MSSESRRHSRTRSRSRARRFSVRQLMVALSLCAVGGAATYSILSSWQSVPDVSGVWVDDKNSTTYTIDRSGAEYRVAVGDRRLPVLGVYPDHQAGLLKMVVRTESGLAVSWKFSKPQGDGRRTFIGLDNDGLKLERLVLQHPVGVEDRQRLLKMRPDEHVAWSPSFDCTKAANSIQRMLCADPKLAAQERKVNRLVKLGNKDFKQSEKEWEMEIRDSCHDLECLRDVYRNRLVSLNLERASEKSGTAGYDLPRPEITQMPNGEGTAAEAPMDSEYPTASHGTE